MVEKTLAQCKYWLYSNYMIRSFNPKVLEKFFTTFRFHGEDAEVVDLQDHH